MEPVFVVLWVTMAVLGGFLTAYVIQSQDIRIGLAVTSSFLAIGLSLGNLMGNPAWPTLVAAALSAGLAWACLDHYWYVREQSRIIKKLLDSVYFHPGNHWNWSSSFRLRTPLRETWGQRLARWGFPSQYQMECEAILRNGVGTIGRGYTERSTRYVPCGDWHS